MESQLLVSPDKLSTVQLTTGEYWVRLALGLTHEFTGGDLVQFAHEATVSVVGTDKLSSSYNRANWVSGVTSGALYAFRTLRIPRQRLVVTELSGRLRASDMDAVANGSAIAIAKLADKELPRLTMEGWSIQAQVSERRPPISSQASQEEAAASARSQKQMSPQRQQELRDMSTPELLLLISVDKIARELSVDEVRLIHDIAAERLRAESNTDLPREDSGKEDGQQIPADGPRD